MQRIAVIGLGRFGMAPARRLAQSPVEVIAIDSDPHLVDDIKDEVSLAVTLDSTDEAALLSQDIRHVDVCVIAIGENFEASLLTAITVKRLGVSRVICRAQSIVHAEIFRRVGADEVIQPEMETGYNLARRLANPQITELLDLSGGYTLVEMKVPEAFVGKSLAEISLRRKYQVNAVYVRRAGGREGAGNATQAHVPGPDFVIERGDTILLVGTETAIAGLPT